jgi:hypothetical protein
MCFKKFNGKTVVLAAVAMIGVAAMAALGADAATTTSPTVTLPTWLESLLTVAGVLGTGATALLGKKVINLVSLVSDLRDTINKSTHFFYAARTKITDPDLVEDFNGTVDAIAKVLLDTGNKNLIQKANDLLKCKAKVDAKIASINGSTDIASTSTTTTTKESTACTSSDGM